MNVSVRIEHGKQIHIVIFEHFVDIRIVVEIEEKLSEDVLTRSDGQPFTGMDTAQDENDWFDDGWVSADMNDMDRSSFCRLTLQE